MARRSLVSIQLPLKIEKSEGAKFCHLTDSTGRPICGGMTQEDAEWLVDFVNSQPRRKSKKVLQEEALRRSDLSAQLSERDNIEYGPHDCLPAGQHVARLKVPGDN